MVIFTGTNLTAVSNFGEFEFWFAALKVAAIGIFLVLGLLAIFGVLPGTHAPGTSHLTGDGGFLPKGVDGLMVGLLASVFAYGGLETVTIAAAESKDPVRGVAGAVRTAMWRIALFYVGSMAIIVTVIPWSAPAIAKSGPYVAVLDYLKHPGGRPDHERGHPDRAALRDERQPLRLLADGVLAHLPRPGPGLPRQGQRRRPAPRRPAVRHLRLPRGGAELPVARHALPVAAEHGRRGRPGGVGLHRHRTAADAPDAGARGAREARREDVGLPGT